jgi:hypothetical protein
MQRHAWGPVSVAFAFILTVGSAGAHSFGPSTHGYAYGPEINYDYIASSVFDQAYPRLDCTVLCLSPYWHPSTNRISRGVAVGHARNGSIIRIGEPIGWEPHRGWIGSTRYYPFGCPVPHWGLWRPYC